MRLNAEVFTVCVLLMIYSSTGWCAELMIHSESILVEDGDTLIIDLPDGKQRVQLMNIDAPEDSENAKFKADLRRTGLDYDTLFSLGAIATQYLVKLITGTERFSLQYQPEKRDRYGRLIGNLKDHNGVSVSERMVLNGYAIANTTGGAETTHPYHALQRNAQEEMRGLWGLLPRQTQLWAGTSIKH